MFWFFFVSIQIVCSRFYVRSIYIRLTFDICLITEPKHKHTLRTKQNQNNNKNKKFVCLQASEKNLINLILCFGTEIEHNRNKNQLMSHLDFNSSHFD